MYSGIETDEFKRIHKPRKAYKLLPLVEWGITEEQAQQGCDQAGYHWMEGSVNLYEILDRVSCWCCANKNLSELRNMYQHLPVYWKKLRDLQDKTNRPFKGGGKSVYELEDRFKKEMFEKQYKKAS